MISCYQAKIVILRPFRVRISGILRASKVAKTALPSQFQVSRKNCHFKAILTQISTLYVVITFIGFKTAFVYVLTLSVGTDFIVACQKCVSQSIRVIERKLSSSTTDPPSRYPGIFKDL